MCETPHWSELGVMQKRFENATILAHDLGGATGFFEFIVSKGGKGVYWEIEPIGVVGMMYKEKNKEDGKIRVSIGGYGFGHIVAEYSQDGVLESMQIPLAIPLFMSGDEQMTEMAGELLDPEKDAVINLNIINGGLDFDEPKEWEIEFFGEHLFVELDTKGEMVSLYLETRKSFFGGADCEMCFSKQIDPEKLDGVVSIETANNFMFTQFLMMGVVDDEDFDDW
jgi:hypothetical protein